MDSPIKTYVYEVLYSDGSEFIKEVSTLKELKELHEEIESLERHISQILNS